MGMKTGKKRVGRPTKPARPGKKMALGLRVTAEIKSALDAEAQRTGRTQSQEAELRLERSFRDQQQLPQALEATYGRQLAALLLVLARVMQDTGSQCGFIKTYALEGAANWPVVPYAYDQVVKAVNRVLEGFRPEGDVSAPVLKFAGDQIPIPDDYYARLGENLANGALGALSSSDHGRELDEWARPIREQMGPLLKRIQHVALMPHDTALKKGSTRS
jgi:hypothetical protein